MEEQKISLEDLNRIKNTMEFYNRTHGYMKFVGNELTFFDGNPGGAAEVSFEDLMDWIDGYKNG